MCLTSVRPNMIMVSKNVQFSLDTTYIILKIAVAIASNYPLGLLSVFLCCP